MYQSLKEKSSDAFILYVLATDKLAYDFFKDKEYDNIVVESVDNIKEKYPILNKLQSERSVGEFNWTLSSFSMQYFLKKYCIEALTYLDADVFFYNDPGILFRELKNESVIITPHNYTPEYDLSKPCGRYCVQFVYVKNDDKGNEVLEWWRKSCEDCCCGIPTNGKFGDQKYLDDWLSRFPGVVHEEKNMGCGVAPWNIQQFDVSIEDGLVYVVNKITKVRTLLIFYHFHGIKEYCDNRNNRWWDFTEGYNKFEDENLINLYREYIKKIVFFSSEIPERNVYRLPKDFSLKYKLYLTLKITIKKIIKALNVVKTYKSVKNKNLYRESELLVF